MLMEENMPLAEKSTHSEWFISDCGGGRGAVGLDASLETDHRGPEKAQPRFRT